MIHQDMQDLQDSGAQMLEVLTPVGTRVEIYPPGAVALATLANVAAAGNTAPLVVAVADLSTSVAAVLDLLDKPGIATGVAVVRPQDVDLGLQHLPPARVGVDGKLVESVGTTGHVVTRPNRALLGLLRVAPAHRGAAATAWRRAADSASPDADPFALAVLALVRSGIEVQAAPLGPFAFSRRDVSAAGAPGGPWQQRLRGASRGGDGFFSTYAVRPLSRKITGVGLRLGWSPNGVTVTSLALGVLAAVLVATGNRGLWVVAALLVQASLVIDCVDGEIARFTRRFSAFGAWLDAVGDRVKEYSVFAAMAMVATRAGDGAWSLAVVAMAVVTVRHLEDYAYGPRLKPVRLSRPDVLPMSEERDRGATGDPTTYPPPRSTRRTVVFWMKKVIHMPIAERYLLISVGLLTGSPRFALWLIIVPVTVAVILTKGRRVLRALIRRDEVPPAAANMSTRWGYVDVQLDLGPLARLFGRVVRLPFLGACLAALLLTIVGVGMIVQHRSWIALLAVLLAGLVIGAGARPPVTHVLAWQLTALVWVMEAAVILAISAEDLVPANQGLAFAFLSAVAYHRYDVVYRLRDTGEPPAAWLSLAGLGVEGRLLLVLAVAAWAPGSLPIVLALMTAWLAALYLAESTAGWRRWIKAQPSAPLPEPVKGGAPIPSPESHRNPGAGG
jgi:hypothetical protein